MRIYMFKDGTWLLRKWKRKRIIAKWTQLPKRLLSFNAFIKNELNMLLPQKDQRGDETFEKYD